MKNDGRYSRAVGQQGVQCCRYFSATSALSRLNAAKSLRSTDDAAGCSTVTCIQLTSICGNCRSPGGTECFRKRLRRTWLLCSGIDRWNHTNVHIGGIVHILPHFALVLKEEEDEEEEEEEEEEKVEEELCCADMSKPVKKLSVVMFLPLRDKRVSAEQPTRSHHVNNQHSTLGTWQYTEMIRNTELYLICDRKSSEWCEASMRCNQSRGMESKRAWICSWGISLLAVCMRVLKASRVELEDHDEQVADKPYPRHVRLATCLANVQAKEAVISVVLPRRLPQSSPHVTRYCHAQIWHVKLPEGGAVLRL
ncbi:hypothetical protein ANN_08786 [Periplaneta americana]|uniref:Uncharacterized protein n=1 Tax=Periplaneta americana TaxID=6978 RepID=A0ABQ8T2F7_PERAM|nr:hypothetical protein ANN_08786 [Periplaneta americana]